MNAVVFLSCILSGLGAYFLARTLGVGGGGALVSGVVFAFAPPRFFRLGQLHLATVQWIPFCLGFFHTYASGGSRRHLIAAVVFFTLQALSGGQSGLFLLLAAAGLLVYLWVSGTLRPRGSLLRDGILAAVLAGVLNLPFLLPYLEVQHDVGFARSLEEAEEWSPNAESFLAAPTHAQRALLSTVPGLQRKILAEASGYLFPGFLTVVLAGLAFSRRRSPEPPSLPAESQPPPRSVAALDALLIISAAAFLLIQASGGIRWEIAGLTISARGAGRAGVVFAFLLAARLLFFRKNPFAFSSHSRRAGLYLRRFFDARMSIPAGFYALLVVLSLWAALGPRFGFYAALYRLVPGFDFIRVPARLTILTLLGLAVLAGAGFDRVVYANRQKPRFLGAVFIMVLVVEFAAFPLDAPPYPLSIPAVERRLAEHPEEVAIVELPIPDPRYAIDSARFHSLYMLYSTAHWHNLVNGYSGFRPPSHDNLFRKLVNFPDEASLDALEDLDVTFAVIHRDRYGSDEWTNVSKRLETFSERLALEFVEGEGRVYRLTRPKTR
jgi:hypothetical protein